MLRLPQHDLENWRIRINKEQQANAKWEDWWGWMAEKDDSAAETKIMGNTKSMINAKEVAPPMFTDKEYLKNYFDSMAPQDKYNTPVTSAQTIGWKSGKQRKPLEPPNLRTSYGRVNARLETNDPR